MAAIPGYKASVYATSTPSVAFTNEAFTDAGDHKNYTITNANKRYWDNTVALTVQTSPDGSTGWTTVTTGFTVNYCGGILSFTNAISGSVPSVRVSGSYLPYSTVVNARSVEIQNDVDILDVTAFDSAGWHTKIANLVGSAYKLDKWWTDVFFVTALDTKRRLVLSAYSGANSNQRFDAFGYIKNDSVKIAVNQAIDESLEFEVDGSVTYIAS